MTDQGKFRLVTRPDFDGVVCGALFEELQMIDEVLFAQPREMQDGRVNTSNRDITANLPYVPGVHLCFDHHSSEVARAGRQDNCVIDHMAPSAARVVYGHFGGKSGFPAVSEALMSAVDKADSADYSEEDILAPEGWTLLNFLLDGRTGLSRIKGFRIDNTQFMVDMMTYCRHHPIADILEIPDVRERVLNFQQNHERGEMQMRRRAEVLDNVVKVDLRGENPIYSVNRFLVYAIFPSCNVSVHLAPLDDGQVEIAVGKSILDRSNPTDVGSLMLEHGGGGHMAVGACRVDPEDADDAAAAVIKRLQG